MIRKLLYRDKGLFVIIAKLSNNNFEVQLYDEPQSSKRKYKNKELYMLHPALFPSEPLNTTNQRFLNSHHAPVINPFQCSMKVALYSVKHLRQSKKLTPTNLTRLNHLSSELDNMAFTPRISSPYPSTSKLHHKTCSSSIAPVCNNLISTATVNDIFLSKTNCSKYFATKDQHSPIKPIGATLHPSSAVDDIQAFHPLTTHCMLDDSRVCGRFPPISCIDRDPGKNPTCFQSTRTIASLSPVISFTPLFI